MASDSLPADLKTRIRESLFVMHQDSEGRRILKKLLIERFLVPEEAWYEPIRIMNQKMQSDHRAFNEAKQS